VWFGDSSEAKLGAGEAGSITLPKGQLKNALSDEGGIRFNRRHGFIEAEAPGQQFF
jgi:hypothetical protein